MADDRTYIKLHDGMPRHPKITGLSDKAFRAYVEALCYCSEYLTDGELPVSSLTKIAPRRVWAELSAAGLVHDTSTGVTMHDYLEHQRSAEQVKQLKEARRRAGSRGGRAKANAVASASHVATDLLKQTGSKVVPETESLSKERDQTETDARPAGKPLRIVGENDNAGQILGAWLDTLPRRPPSSVVGQLAKHTKALLADGFTPTEITAGLAAWQSKNLHPATLPSVVNEIVNKPTPPALNRDLERKPWEL